MVVFAVLVLIGTGRGAAFYAVLFAVCGLVSARYLPWRFAVLDEGIALWFPFGRRLFLPKDAVTVRVGLREHRGVPGGVPTLRLSAHRRSGRATPDGRCGPCSSSTASVSPDGQPRTHCFTIGFGFTSKPTRSNQPSS